ncbi:hydroxymethylbilane synthase [Corynebacterium caspium]|uniref:hydroxymethylbilane synthase n=1 Tax=Corynebacterium caspium TaxID=234828 RepID=UPI000365122B|nr:hydroxymethylbilane synthase [Corynebacterium caspium]WKD59906.1 Porphobilinogen deaminase [Corynebacterium caspium DSM 44850]
MNALDPQNLRIGTRGSKLATTQSGHVRDAIQNLGHQAELHIVTTAGDVNMAPVERIGVGVFTQALREAMANGECDIAVHSFKDLPTAPDERFHLVVPRRENPREALIARDGLQLETLPLGARVGTSAPRRISQLRARRPDLEILPLRGNIDTRMAKVHNGELDAVILAAAGLARVEMLEVATEIFDPREFMPAPAQGALAIECRATDSEIVAILDALACPDATDRAQAERSLLSTLEAGCTAPVAAHATLNGSELTLRAGVFALDGTMHLVAERSGDRVAATEIGIALAQELLQNGAAEVMTR